MKPRPAPPRQTNNYDLPLPYARPGTFWKDAMNTTPGASPEDLRNRLVDAIVKEDISGLRDARVEAAMRTVPRHAFLPDAPLEEAYANKSVTIKENPDEDALPLSCASQPDVVHFMLVQLAVRLLLPARRVRPRRCQAHGRFLCRATDHHHQRRSHRQ